MNLERRFRNAARRAVDSVFCSSSPGIRRVGDERSGWVIQTSPAPVVCYCAGVGKEMTFEQELATLAGKPVLVFDPSPTGVATIARTATENLRFFPVGLAKERGVVEFSLPEDAEEGSYSVAKPGVEKISFECWDLETVMAQNGDTRIDLLKMDIEGFEYGIVHRLLDEKVPVRQICVEFHPWLRPGETWKTIRRLYGAGYRIIHKQRGDYTFLRKDNIRTP